MNKEINKLAKKIAAELKNIDRLSPVDQLTTYFCVGEKLAAMFRDPIKYGDDALADLVSLVPSLKNDDYAFRFIYLSDHDDKDRDLMMQETMTPMCNGQHLTTTHWFWLFRHQPKDVREDERDAWLRQELEFFRRESPSAAMLDHFDEILEDECQREAKSVREEVRNDILAML